MKLKYSVITLLILLSLFLFYKNFVLRKKIKKNIEIPKCPTVILDLIPTFLLYDLNGVRYRYDDILNSKAYTLLVFFSPVDCRSCLNERDLWNRISKERRIKIIGIATHSDKKELKDWVENSEIYFPVLYDEESQITNKLNIKRTPLKLLIDSKGKILLIDRVRITLYEQKEFIKILDEMIK